MKLIVVGAGAATRDLLRGLGDAWDVTVIDPDGARLEAASLVRDIDPLLGNGADAEVLRAAGLDQANALVAASTDDDVNLAACRLARAARVGSVAAVAADPERLPDYRAEQVAAFSPDRLAARRVETTLEPRRVSSAEFAAGLAEAMEFRIARDSPMRGRALQDLDRSDWLVVAILRGGELIVPHGATVLETDDIVTVVGDAARSADVVEAFTAGQARFPRDHGPRVATLTGASVDADARVAEAAYLMHHSEAEGLALLHPPSANGEALAARVRELVSAPDVVAHPLEGARPSAATAGAVAAGVLVVGPPAGSGWRGRRESAALVRHAREIQRPVLVARSSHPYSRIVVEVSAVASGRAAAGAAVDLAAIQSVRLIGVRVVAPPFIAAPDTREASEAAAIRLAEAAAIQNVALEMETREGNPVRVMDEVAGADSLLVVGLPDAEPSALNPGVVGHLVRRTAGSVLLVPALS